MRCLDYNNKMNRNYDEVIKIMLVGDANVGKTSIMRRFCHQDSFDFDNIRSTVGLDYDQKILAIKAKNVLVQMWDTAGQQKFQSLTPSFYKSAMGIFLVFSMTDKSSFNSIQLWMRQIKLYASEQVPVVIMCNKVDVNPKEVSEMQSRNLGERHGVSTIYTSALDNKNITESVLEMYNKIKQQKKIKKLLGTMVSLTEAKKEANKGYFSC